MELNCIVEYYVRTRNMCSFILLNLVIKLVFFLSTEHILFTPLHYRVGHFYYLCIANYIFRGNDIDFPITLFEMVLPIHNTANRKINFSIQ